MSTPEEKRAFLDAWTEREGSAEELAASFPNCGCEGAAASASGPGPIVDDEVLRYFITSRSNLDLKRERKIKVTANIFKRAFSKGMSVVRMGHASVEEVLLSADILWKNSVKDEPHYGGVCGVVDFPAIAVRRYNETGGGICCVLETPLPERPSHGDVVYHSVAASPEEALSIRSVLFNQVGGMAAFKTVPQVEDCDLAPFLPECLKAG